MKRKIPLQQALVKERQVRWERFIARGGHPVLLMDTIRRSNLGFLKPLLNIPNLRYWKRYAETSFFEQNELERVRNVLEQQLRHDPKKVAERIDNLQRVLRNGVAWAKRITRTSLRKRSDDALWSIAETAFHWSDQLWTSAYFPMIADQVMKRMLLVRGMSEEDIGKYTAPTELTLLQKKQNVFYRLRKRYGMHLLRALRDRLQYEYGWVNSYVLHRRPYTAIAMRKDFRSATMLAKPRHSVIPKRFRHITKLILLGRSLVTFRDTRLFFATQFFYYLYPLFSELARRMGIDYDAFVQMTSEEILARMVPRQEIRERQKGVGYLVLDGVASLCTGASLRALERRDRVTATRVLRGISAYHGHVRGTVRKVNPYTYEHIRKGDVIVTGMTTPEIVQFLSRVAAIVTDEGGITAHAAIVAREYKIPCVMGTKIATKVFHDGQKVEVDAVKGIVRKI